MGVPRGNFIHTNTENPAVLIAGGLGITPLISIFKSIHKTNQTLFIHCTKNSKTEIFKDELLGLENEKSKLITLFDNPLETDVLGESYDYKGLLTYNLLSKLKFDNPDTEFYLCGPEVFRNLMIEYLLKMGIPDSKIHFESLNEA